MAWCLIPLSKSEILLETVPRTDELALVAWSDSFDGEQKTP